MVLNTLSTVGYSGVLPLSQPGRIFNSMLMLSGIMVVFVCFGIMADTRIQKPSKEMLFNPVSDIPMEAGDYLIAMGETKDLKRMEDEFESSVNT
jgi:hypothetical protein